MTPQERKVIELALEALWTTANPKAEDAIKALEKALAQPEQEPVAWIHNFIDGGISIGKRPADLNRHPDRWTALYKEPKPCPTCEALARTVMLDQTSHDTAPPQRKEPEKEKKPAAKIYVQLSKSGGLVASVWWLDQGLSVGNYDLYTTPPQRKPLTDEQILHFVDTHVGAPSMAYPLDNSDWMNFARAIEAAHGIKD